MYPYLLNILKSLELKLNLRANVTPSLKELVRAAANTNRWTFPHQISTRSASLVGARGW
jgi:hypothetical protein